MPASRAAARRAPWLAAGVALLLALPPGIAGAEGPAGLNATLNEADVAHLRAERLFEEERLAEAVALAERDVALHEKVVAFYKGRLPKQHTPATPSPELLLGAALDQLGWVLIELGQHRRAEEVFARAHAIYGRILVAGDEELAGLSIAGLARLAGLRGDSAAADGLRREVGAFDALLGSPFPCLAYSEVGRLFAMRADHDVAEAMLRLAAESYRGKPAVQVELLRNLADLALERGEPEAAEPLLVKALEAASASARAAGTPSPRLARVLDSLGRLHLAIGRPDRAVQAFTRALALQEEALGPGHLAAAESLDGLALGHMQRGEPGRAAPLLDRALAIREQVLGPGHPATAALRLHLGDLRRATGDDGAAAALYHRAQADLEEASGPDHPAVAEALLRRAALARGGGRPDPGRSEALSQRALAIVEKVFGPLHPRVADALDALAEGHLRAGGIPSAAQALARSTEIRDRRAAALLADSSEEQKLAAVEALRGQTDLVLALPAAASPQGGAAVDLALTTILRRKGRALDALATGRAALRDRQRPEDARLLRELVAIQGAIVDAIVRGPGAVPAAEHDAALAELERQKARLEAELGKRGATLLRDDRLVTLAEVKAAIPEDAALVEMIVRRPVGEAAEAPRLAAYVLRRRGAARFVDLGEARAAAGLVDELRQALASPRRDPALAARALDERVLRPLRPLLGDARRILISPDGELNLVPFGALLDEGGRALIERFTFTYLSSGRDLVRFLHDETPPEPGPAAVLIGAPDFGDPDRQRSRYRPGAGPDSVELGDIRFRPLPGTAEEIAAIGAVIPGAKALTGAAATEEAVQAVAHPRILHIATHGFFLPPVVASAGRALESPLLRGGLALATANQPVTGREDGILTAHELAGLDLYGTRLVVLSACETGVGAARSGDGVYGLRRAVLMAGAQTLVMSLWKISDQETRDLMVQYHRRLQGGGGRSEALREAALAVRAAPGNQHPFYWAGFISAGDGSSLDGKDVPQRPAPPPPVAPGPRGCGCAVGPGSGGSAAALALVALLLGCLRRRRRPEDRRA
ncbi:CHAT domain-containing tetratricopeptide repeat protein [Sorangium sp. So ce281]|uniref:CHAT domain-containing protein n=1 Tax=unclassified Sorangium TaxID=2621164 RepID=UPI003F5EB879